MIETAARECEEETRGILGPKAKIMETLAKCDYIFHKGYAMYPMPIDPAKVNFNDFYANRNWKECQKEKTELAVVKADHLFRTVDFYQTQGGRGIWLSGNSDRQTLRRPFVECLSTAIEKHGSSQNLINSLPKI